MSDRLAFRNCNIDKKQVVGGWRAFINWAVRVITHSLGALTRRGPLQRAVS